MYYVRSLDALRTRPRWARVGDPQQVAAGERVELVVVGGALVVSKNPIQNHLPAQVVPVALVCLEGLVALDHPWAQGVLVEQSP
jgi:hypothetical protein